MTRTLRVLAAALGLCLYATAGAQILVGQTSGFSGPAAAGVKEVADGAKLYIDAINAQDFAVVRAMVFIGSVLYIVGLILTDLSYTLADPRVRLQ